MNKRKRKLELLKAIVASQKLSQKLTQEKQLNLLQTKMMENELNAMKQKLEELELQKEQVLKRSEQLEAPADNDID